MPARLLGAKVAQLRQHHGLTQAQLAQRVGIKSNTHLSNLETMRDRPRDTPSLKLVLAIAHVFPGVTLEYLLRDTQPVTDQADTTVAVAPPDVLPHQLGVRLRALREQAGWTQHQAAQALGLTSQAYISNLEQGRKELPSIDIALRMADVYGVSLDDLLRDPRTPA